MTPEETATVENNLAFTRPPANPIVDRRTALMKFGFLSRELYKSPYAHLWREILPFLTRLRYFSAPASKKFHLSCTGGLLVHSVQVTDIAIGIASDRFQDLDPYKIMLAGLLHDIGKCGLWTEGSSGSSGSQGRIFETGESSPQSPQSRQSPHAGFLQERYLLNPEPFPTWPKQQKWWTPYLFEDSKPMFTIRDLSALYCANYRLPWDVVQAVLAHDGLWAEGNKDYLRNVHPLLLVIMSADYMSAQGLETKGSAIERRLDL